MQQMAQSLNEFHKENIVHNDVKLSNFYATIIYSEMKLNVYLNYVKSCVKLKNIEINSQKVSN